MTATLLIGQVEGGSAIKSRYKVCGSLLPLVRIQSLLKHSWHVRSYPSQTWHPVFCRYSEIPVLADALAPRRRLVAFVNFYHFPVFFLFRLLCVPAFAYTCSSTDFNVLLLFHIFLTSSLLIPLSRTSLPHSICALHLQSCTCHFCGTTRRAVREESSYVLNHL